jgi:hypothetical protein
MRRGVTGRAKARSIGRSRHPVQVGTIIVAIGLENPDACWDDMMWEIRKKDNVAIGKAVCHHECVKIRARDSQHFTYGTIKVRRDGILMVVLIFFQVDTAAPHGARRR